MFGLGDCFSPSRAGRERGREHRPRPLTAWEDGGSTVLQVRRIRSGQVSDRSGPWGLFVDYRSRGARCWGWFIEDNDDVTLFLPHEAGGSSLRAGTCSDSVGEEASKPVNANREGSLRIPPCHEKLPGRDPLRTNPRLFAASRSDVRDVTRQGWSCHLSKWNNSLASERVRAVRMRQRTYPSTFSIVVIGK